MNDRVSNYRQVRLVLQVPTQKGSRAYVSMHAVGVRRGVPTARILLDGYVGALDPAPTTEEMLEAFDAFIRQNLLG